MYVNIYTDWELLDEWWSFITRSSVIVGDEWAELDDRPLDVLCKFCKPLEGGNLLEPINGFEDIDWWDWCTLDRDDDGYKIQY